MYESIRHKIVKETFMKNHLKLGLVLSLIFIVSSSLSFASSRVINKGSSSSSKMSLTFDDGGSTENVRRVMTIMESHEVRGTFFPTGDFIAKNPELMKEILDRGHEVGNHSYNHPDFRKISKERMVRELSSSAEAFRKATGEDMKPYFRPPYGSYNSNVLNAASEAGFHYTVMWSIDTNDWKKISSDSIRRHVVSNAGNGKIVLMHTLPGLNTAASLDGMIKDLKDKGYELVTISELLYEGSNSADHKPKPFVLSDPEDMLPLEFLNNLLYVKTGSYYASEQEIKALAVELGIIEDLNSSLTKRVLKLEEAKTYVSRAFGEKQDEALAVFETLELKKSNLNEIVNLLKGI